MRKHTVIYRRADGFEISRSFLLTDYECTVFDHWEQTTNLKLQYSTLAAEERAGKRGEKLVQQIQTRQAEYQQMTGGLNPSAWLRKKRQQEGDTE